MVGAANNAQNASESVKKAANNVKSAVGSAAANVKNFIVNNKKIAIICAAALAAVVAIIIIIVIIANAAQGPGAAIFDRNDHSVLAFDDGGDLLLYVDGKEIKNSLEYNGWSEPEYYYGCGVVRYNGGLYKIEGEKLREINDDVSSVYVSSNENAVAYVSDEDVYLYKDGKETKIYSIDGYLWTMAISPNGNVVAINARDDDGYVTYLSKGSKAQKFSDEYLVGIVSDDASVMYATAFDDESELYVIKNEKADDAERIKDNVGNLNCVSKDNKKILFTVSGNTYYYAPDVKDDEPIRVSKGSVTPLFPENTVKALDDFKSFVALDGGSIKLFSLNGDEFESETIVSSASNVSISLDGKTLVYTKSGDLYSVKASKNAEPVRLEKDIRSYDADATLTKIYISDDDSNLVFSDGRSKKTTKISSDVYDYAVSMDGVCCYIDDKDVLYTTSGASKGNKVDKMSNTESVYTSGGSIFTAINDDTLYISADGKTFTKTDYEY